MTRDLPTSLARMVIAEAWRRHLASQVMLETHIAQACIWCSAPLTDNQHTPYCSSICAISAEQDL